MKFILGTKQKMTQIFDKEGVIHPATVINAGPVVVTQVKSSTKDGYQSVQVGFGAKKASSIGKSMKGHTKELGNFRFLKEFRSDTAHTVGDKIDAASFKEGDIVVVSSTSKGKGFQGVVKRHGFAGGSRTHGQKHSEREPGAIGGGARAGGRVAKGIRMAGRMGGDRVTQKNLKIVQVNSAENLILIEGAIPGVRGALVEIVSEAK
jgi:large subunit ribosomal protein L3